MTIGNGDMKNTIKSKSENVLLRISSEDHNVIQYKAHLNGFNKSAYLRHAALSFWDDPNDRKEFKTLTEAYQTATDKDKDIIIDLLFNYYRSNGFPYYKLNDQQKSERMDRLIKTTCPLMDGDVLNRNIVAVELASSFHPHMMGVKYSNTNTFSPLEMYKDDNRLRDCIKRWLDLGNVVNPSGLRRILKIRDGARSVVNFKPSISKFIYQTHVPYGGRVLDPCAGYSGRLVGCIASMKNLYYHGIDPDGRTACGNMECASFFASQYDGIGERLYPFGFRFDLGCAEDIMKDLSNESYDIIFTSPPYFNVERYSEDCNQSYKRYMNYEDWLNKFLYVIVDQSRRLLKSGGKIILNVKNYKKYNIADDLLKYCVKNGWVLLKQYNMKLANLEYRLKEGDGSYHTEPIFVFGKR